MSRCSGKRRERFANGFDQWEVEGIAMQPPTYILGTNILADSEKGNTKIQARILTLQSFFEKD